MACTVMFWIIVAVSVAALIFWKVKIDPDGGSFWVYLVWVIVINLISFWWFGPWGLFKQSETDLIKQCIYLFR